MAVSDLKCSRGDKLHLREQLFAFAADGNLVALEQYLINGGSINAKNEDGLALVHFAACNGNVPLIRKLREHGADMNLLDDGAPAWKPIHYAIFHRRHEAEEILRTLGAEAPLPILKRSVRENPASFAGGTWQAKFGNPLVARHER